MRPGKRSPDELRPISFQRNFTKHAEGSVLATYGNTKIICTATVENNVPRFLRDSNQGWLTAEYGMLPRATEDRTQREACRGKQGGRTLEIQRLIGRSLRAAIDLTAIKGYCITIDCDVIQADGGTRTAAISGGYVALVDAIHKMQLHGMIERDPIIDQIAAVSVGIYKNHPVLDLEYLEDVNAQSDMNIVMNSRGAFIEIQGTAESQAFHEEELQQLIFIAKKGIQEIMALQKEALQ